MATSGKIGTKGLSTSGNRLTFEPGTVTTADNVAIPSQAEMQPCRGQMLQSEYAASTNGYIDGDSTDASSNRAKELYQWGSTLLVNYTGSGGYKLASFAAWATAPSRALVGSFTPPDPTRLRMKFAQLALSVYWTTDSGLYALDVVGGTAVRAGVQRSTGIYPSDYANSRTSNLTGNPNATGSWLQTDMAVAYRVVFGRKDANGVVKLSAPTGRYVVANPADLTMAAGTVVLAGGTVTVTLAAGQTHGLRVSDVVNLTLSGGDVGNLTATNRVILTATSAGFTYADPNGNFTNVASVVFTSGYKSVAITVSVPAEAVAGDFMQLYRTDESATAAIDPGDECHLAYERTLTATDVAFTYASVTDTTPSSSLGAPLSTNANSGDGIALGFNERPPACNDICVWDGRLWGGKTTDRHRLALRLLGVGSPNGLQTGDKIAVNTRVMTAGSMFVLTDQYLPTKNIDMTVASMALNMGVDLYDVTAYSDHDGDTGLGEVLLEQTTPNSTFTEGSSGAISAIYAATDRQTAFGDALPKLSAVVEASSSRTGSTVTITTSAAHGLTAGQTVMIARAFGSAIDANFPLGLKTIVATPLTTTFTYTEAGSAVTMAVGDYYAYAATYKSDNNQQPVRFSNPGKPWSWPLVNTLGGLPDGADVLRVAPSGGGYSLLVFLKDGAIYRVSGQYPYIVRRLDDTATLLAADSLVPHSGKLHALTTQGACSITESGVAIVGSSVEDSLREVWANIVSGSLDASTIFGTSYESDRQYQLWVPISSAYASRSYVYQSLYGQFTRFVKDRRCGLVFRGPDLLVMGDGSTNQLRIERKFFGSSLWKSFADQRTTITGSYTPISSTTMRYTTADSISGVTAGDALSLASAPNTYYRVTAVGSGHVDFAATISDDTDNAYIFRKQSISVTFAPDGGGAPGIEKRWREVQLHFGSYLAQQLSVSFANERTTSNTVTVTDSNFAFGTADTGIRLVRVSVPQSVQMGSTLNVTISLAEAFSYFQLYGVSATAEPVSERSGR